MSGARAASPAHVPLAYGTCAGQAARAPDELPQRELGSRSTTGAKQRCARVADLLSCSAAAYGRAMLHTHIAQQSHRPAEPLTLR